MNACAKFSGRSRKKRKRCQYFVLKTLCSPVFFIHLPVHIATYLLKLDFRLILGFLKFISATMHWYSGICILLLCIAYFAQSVEISQENKDIIDTGVTAGQEIADVLKESNFRQSIVKVARFGSAFLSSIGPIASVLLAFTDTGDSDELKHMRKEFKNINSKLDVLTSEFRDLRDHINWNTVKVSK